MDSVERPVSYPMSSERTPLTDPRGRPTPARRVLLAKLERALSHPEGVAFLDIETTGLSRYYHSMTLVGSIHAGESRSWIAGDDPAEIVDVLASAKTLVTFNGTSFDIPFVRSIMPGLPVPPDHIDLRYAARQVGLSGGQKAIERELGLERKDGVLDVDGPMAVLLWFRYLRGDVAALRTLIEYNRADLEGMRAILDHVGEALAVGRDQLFGVATFARLPFKARGWSHELTELPDPGARGFARRNFAEMFGVGFAPKSIVGVDLTGSEARPSGYASLVGSDVSTERIGSDDEIVAAIERDRPRLVSIDSPLGLPRGRTVVTDDDPGRAEFGILRQCERMLKRRGINVYPCLLPSMQKLTARGMRLARRLRKMGYPVIESYPGAAQDIMGIPRKRAGLEFLASGLADFGLSGTFASEPVSHDELDAITCAVVGAFFLSRLYEALGDPDEDPLIVPSLKPVPARRIIGISGRIAAGKTTLARMLEARGFAYARYSEVVDDVIVAEGGGLDRETRQRVGWRLHENEGQRWMGRRLMERLGDAQQCVVEGMRWPEDHAFLAEQAGNGFLHVNVQASPELRRSRYAAARDAEADFDRLDGQLVESGISALQRLATSSVDNEGNLAELARRADELASAAL